MTDKNKEETLNVNTDTVSLAMGNQLIASLMQERRSEQRWKWFKRITFSSIGAILFAIYLAFYVTSLGYKVMPKDDIVGVVTINGPIGAGEIASSEKIIPALKKAFEAKNVKAIVLSIDSGGGQPNESEKIYRYIEHKRKETGKPVIAVANNLAASAAYLIGIHADQFYAGKYSLVGSIGAVMHGWDFHRALEKVDVAERTFASGKHKNLMSPYSAMTPAGEDKLSQLVNSMGTGFASEVQKQRQGKLKPGIDYFTGEVWGGEEALAIGIVDGISTVDDIAQQRFKLKTYDFGPSADRGFSFLGSFTDALVGSVVRLASRESLTLN